MIKNAIKHLFRHLGYDIARHTAPPPSYYCADFESLHRNIIEKVKPYTITGPERIHALIESTRYILRNNLKGAFVECGVYKGGSMMTMALTLLAEGVKDRDLYLFDTFEGMPAPDENDVDLWGVPASVTFSEKKMSAGSSTWANSSLDNVNQVMALTGYPMERIHYIKGLVEETLPERAPESIALLRLDTDWYKSTYHELVHLFPRLSPQGVLIIDDYGHFEGARKAVDEYFSTNKLSPFLHRLDYTGRLIVKGE